MLDEYVPFWDGLVEEAEFSYDENDKLRFLKKCEYQPHPDDPSKRCLVFTAGRSRGGGKNIWYTSFYTKGKTVRGHVFFQVAFLKRRRGVGEQYDHTCCRANCVTCIDVIPGPINSSLSRGGRGRAR